MSIAVYGVGLFDDNDQKKGTDNRYVGFKDNLEMCLKKLLSKRLHPAFIKSTDTVKGEVYSF